MKDPIQISALALALLAPLASPAQAQCEETLYASNNQFSTPGATIFFDLTTTGSVSIDAIEVNSTGAAGTPLMYEIWTKAGTYAGSEMDQTLWTLTAMDDGTALAMGVNNPSRVTLLAPFSLSPGVTGIAIVAIGPGFRYTNGTGSNQQYVGANLTFDTGSVTSETFTGLLFQPRVFNGAFCVAGGGGAGVPFCDPNENNSTGLPTNMTASLGTGVGSDLHLDANQGPSGQFGYFLVGTAVNDPGIMIPNSNGRLCLLLGGGNSLGRYNVGGGTQFNSLGRFDASGVLQNQVGTAVSGTGFDVPTTVPISGSPQIMSGETWHFQLWHRESGGLSNFSNGISVTFP